jgi:2-amino-4-hydroxy-6-hydroxymethyldihydropteridine diphosphokinase
MTTAYVGLGANIGDPRRQLELAIEALKMLPETEIVQVSGIYKSAPMGYLDQPDFLNAVARLETKIPAEQLLEHLQKIEQRQGRKRPFTGAPRTLDLDLLLYGDRILDTPQLTLPHPRMHERAFVLRPLLDLDPDASVPGKGAARDLLAGRGGQIVERADG